MNYRIVNISTGSSSDCPSVLIIYTGGTIGMISDESGSLISFNFKQIISHIPALTRFDLKITVISFPETIDSSTVQVHHWMDMAYIIKENYNQYSGFVVLHGTDTMAFSASALSFLLQGLNKPVIFTGSQLPIGALRTDARENLITALEIASTQRDGVPVISEVCIYFSHLLLRGNRSKKVRSSHFSAFESANFPPLAVAGTVIDYNFSAIRPCDLSAIPAFNNKMDSNVTILKMFPGITEEVVDSILRIEGLKGVVLETYGSGNALTEQWFIDCLAEAISRDVVILNISQCTGGMVVQGKYATSKLLKEIGVLSGGDMTTEAAITKMMYLLGEENSLDALKNKLITSICGEMA